MATLTGDPVVVHVPTLMGARAARPVHRLYADHFIGHMAGDMGLGLVSRTATLDQIVDEMTISFTHNVETPWVLPGVAPTDAEWWCRSWQWSVCVTVSSTASTSTGIRHRSSRRSGCSSDRSAGNWGGAGRIRGSRRRSELFNALITKPGSDVE